MYLTAEKINAEEFLKVPEDLASGAEVIFLGVVRNHSEGRKVLHLEYETFESMAENLIEAMVQKVFQKWPVTHVKILHRTGVIALGEIAVAIQVCSAHRAEAYEASRFLIERIKHNVPIWKKEHFTDGTREWSLCRHGNAIPAA